jgi:integrase
LGGSATHPQKFSKEPLLPTNPCPDDAERVHGVPSRDRQRTTLLRTSGELKAYWAAALHLPTPVSQFFRVGLLTGQRRSQILRLRRDQVKEIGVPPIRAMLFGEADMKMEEMHLCPLTGMVENILDELPVFEGSPWYFTYDGSRPFNYLTRYKEDMDRMMTLSGWVIHDLRRTIRSHMESIELPNGENIKTEVLEQILSHKQQGIVGVYQLYRHLKRMRDALELWQQYLMKIVHGKLDIELVV